MKKLRVAVIYGGAGCEHEVSKMSAANILPELAKLGLQAFPVFIDKRGLWHLGEGGERVYPMKEPRRGVLIGEGGRVSLDVALPLLHGDFGEDGRVQGALDCAGIPYVGCGVRAGAVAADKLLTKAVASSLGIPTAAAVSPFGKDMSSARLEAEEEIGYPMFIKPCGLGSSVGCSLVCSPEDFDEAWSAAARYGRAIIEEYLDGARELECAYSDTARFGEIFAPPGEVVARGVYTYRAKYSEGSRARVISRAELPESVKRLAREYSEKMVRAIGISQLARIDYFLKDGVLYLNEINTMPGFTASSLYAAMLRERGIELPELLSALLEDAYDRRS